MTKHITRAATVSSILAVSTSVYANDNKEEIIVTAKGQQTIDNVLHTSHVFTLEDIETAQAKDIPALLDHLSGINISDAGGRGSATSVFVRGTSNSQIIVLIDGVRVGSATLGSAALNSYPIEAIERIEVLKGPFSGIYGADGVGGVIQLFTKKGGDGLGAVRATVGSDSLLEYDLAFNGQGERYSFHLAAHTEDSDGIDRTSIVTDGNEDLDGYEETSYSFGGQLLLSDAVTAKLSILATDSTVEFDNTFGADPDSKTDVETLSTALAIQAQLNQDWSWSTTLGLNEDESVTSAAFSSAFTTNRESIGTEFTHAFASNSLLTFGVDHYQEDIESSNDYAITDRDNTGLYAQWQHLGDTLGVVASLRYDDNSAYGTDSNGSLAINLNISDELRAVASYGTAFVAPSFNFLYFPFFGNPDLLPEESESIELSLLGNYETVNWRLSAYRTDVENLFSFDPQTFLAANVGKAKIDGIEMELSTTLANWLVSVNADVLEATNQDTGTELDDRAERALSLSAQREFGPLNLRFDVKSESGRFDNRGSELSGYGLFDISAIYQFNEQLEVSANVDNVFDKDYTINLIGATERYNTEGRQAKLSIRYRF